MSDSNTREDLDAKHERDRERRVAGVKRWAEYVKTHDPDEWGEQQNRLVDSQLESARQSEIGVEHRRRVARAGREHSQRE